MDPDKFKIIRELKGFHNLKNNYCNIKVFYKTSISEKLIIHSQEEKAKRLEYLVKHLIQKKFKNQILDIHYVIMSLLLRISKSPLDNDFFEKKLKIYSPEKKKEQTIKDFCLHNKNAEKQIVFY